MPRIYTGPRRQANSRRCGRLTRYAAADAAAGNVLAYYVEALSLRPEEADSELVTAELWTASGVQCMVFLGEAAGGR